MLIILKKSTLTSTDILFALLESNSTPEQSLCNVVNRDVILALISSRASIDV